MRACVRACVCAAHAAVQRCACVCQSSVSGQVMALTASNRQVRRQGLKKAPVSYGILLLQRDSSRNASELQLLCAAERLFRNFHLLKLELSADCRPKKAGTAPAAPTPLGKHGNRYESIFSHKSWERLSCGLQKDLSVSPICKGATNSLCANLRMCPSA